MIGVIHTNGRLMIAITSEVAFRRARGAFCAIIAPSAASARRLAYRLRQDDAERWEMPSQWAPSEKFGFRTTGSARSAGEKFKKFCPVRRPG